MRCWVYALFAALWAGVSSAGEVTVAVASNFLSTAEKIAAAFTAETGHEVLLSNGSTGLLYVQIVNGAPYDIFLSADEERPARLLNEGRARDTRPYAIGAIALVSKFPVDPEDAQVACEGTTVA